MACYAVILGTTAEDTETYGLDTTPTITPPDGGLFSAIGDVFDAITGVFTLILGALVFNVPGTPFFIQIPIAITIIGTLTWSLVTLIRGN